MTYSNTVRSIFLLSLVSLLTAFLFVASAEAREHDTSDRDTVRDEAREDTRQDRENREREESNDTSGSSSNTSESSSSVSVSVSVTASGGETVHEIVENIDTTGGITVRSSNTLEGDVSSRHEGGTVRVTQSSVERHGR